MTPDPAPLIVKAIAGLLMLNIILFALAVTW